MKEENSKPNIVIAGAGSIGFFIGGLLQISGHKVCFLARQNMIERIQNHNLRLTDYLNLDARLNADQLALKSSPECLSIADIILVTVKSASTEEMASLIKQHTKTNAVVISMQNGLSNSKILKSNLPNHEVLAGMVPFNVAQMDNNRFHRGTSGNIVIEAGRGKLAQLLSSKSLTIEESNKIEDVQSGKLLINLNNALNALSGLHLLEQIEDRRWRRIMADQMSEAHAIMKLSGMKPVPPSPVPAWLIPHILRLPTPLFKLIAKQMLQIDPHARSSMWEDLKNGRITEVNELQGEVIKLANKLNLQAPLNYQIMARIKEAEKRCQGSPHINPEDI